MKCKFAIIKSSPLSPPPSSVLKKKKWKIVEKFFGAFFFENFMKIYEKCMNTFVTAMRKCHARELNYFERNLRLVGERERAVIKGRIIIGNMGAP